MLDDCMSPLGAAAGVVIYPILTMWLMVGMLFVSEEYFSLALEGIVEKYNVPDAVAGATVLAVGTSFPEVIIGFIAQFLSREADPSITLGVTLGSAIFNQLAIVGACVLVAPGGALRVSWRAMLRDVLAWGVTIVITAGCLADGKVTALEGWLMVAFYFVYVLVCAYWPWIATRLLPTKPPGRNVGRRADAAGKDDDDHDFDLDNGHDSEEDEDHHEGDGEDAEPLWRTIRTAKSSIYLPAKFEDKLKEATRLPPKFEDKLKAKLKRIRAPKLKALRESSSSSSSSSPSGAVLSSPADSSQANPLLAAPPEPLPLPAVTSPTDLADALLRGDVSGAQRMMDVLYEDEGDAEAGAALKVVHEDDEDENEEEDEEEEYEDHHLSGKKKSSPTMMVAMETTIPSNDSNNDHHNNDNEHGENGGGGGDDGGGSGGRALGPFPRGAAGLTCVVAVGWWVACAPFGLACHYGGLTALRRRRDVEALALAAAALIAACSYFMVQCLELACCLAGVPTITLSLLVVASGTCLPELVVSMVVARKGQGTAAVSTALGSNIFDTLIALGLPWAFYAAAVEPVRIESAFALTLIMALSTATFLLFSVAGNWTYGRWQGYALLALYGAFNLYVALDAIPAAHVPGPSGGGR